MNPKSLNMVAVASFVLAVLSLCQRPARADVVMQLVGSNQGYNMGGVYTSPYQITVTINGVPTPLVLACDDFETDINFGDKWLADVNHLMDVAPGGPQKFDGLNGVLPSDPVNFPDGTTASYTIEQRYDAAAWLADQLISDPSILNNQMQSGYYSYAIWQIFESKAYEGWGGTAANPNLSPDQLTHVQDAMKAAFAAVTNVKTG